MTRPWLAALAGLLGTACLAPLPRIPFQSGPGGWHASVLGGDWTVNKSFVEDTSVVGLEVVLDQPDTGGWAWEIGARYATGDGDGERRTSSGTVVPSEREIDYYEFDMGVRQIYRQGERFQPYFGVGGNLLQSRSEEDFVDGTTMKTDHERGEILPGVYMRTGALWNLLRGQLREDSEFPIAVDVRGLLSFEYSYLELSLSFGFGRFGRFGR
jgi:hypothetical protein